MLWEKNRDLAIGLRNQGLADCLAARFALRPVDLKLFGQAVTFAHLVVLKCQQSVEKLTKGYLLWHSQSFDPTKGHTPFTELIEDQPDHYHRALQRLMQVLNRGRQPIVKQLKWLEALAPKRPTVAEDQRGNLQSLEIIRENSEYPFWSAATGCLVTPAQGISLLNHALPAFKIVRNYLTAVSMSDPPEYCHPVRDFLEDHPMSTEIMEWPPSRE